MNISSPYAIMSIIGGKSIKHNANIIQAQIARQNLCETHHRWPMEQGLHYKLLTLEMMNETSFIHPLSFESCAR